jgi:hypothetical protein
MSKPYIPTIASGRVTVPLTVTEFRTPSTHHRISLHIMFSSAPPEATLVDVAVGHNPVSVVRSSVIAVSSSTASSSWLIAISREEEPSPQPHYSTRTYNWPDCPAVPSSCMPSMLVKYIFREYTYRSSVDMADQRSYYLHIHPDKIRGPYEFCIGLGYKLNDSLIILITESCPLLRSGIKHFNHPYVWV